MSDIVSLVQGESLLEAEKDRVKEGFGDCGFIGFWLEVEKGVDGISALSKTILKGKEKVVRFEEPGEFFVGNFLE